MKIMRFHTKPLVLVPLLSALACSAENDVEGTGGSSTGGISEGSGGDSTSGGSSSGGTNATGGTSGSGGAAPSCTPSSGTEDVGTSSFLDKATCLTWQKANTYSGTVVNRVGAKHCEDLVQDGFEDWRLPTAQELRTYPSLADAANAYLAGPIYIPSGSTPAEGCTTNSHSCNLTQYSVGNFGCAWQGPGANGYGVLCVRGEAGITLDSAFEVATCCSSSSTFQEADCSAYP